MRTVFTLVLLTGELFGGHVRAVFTLVLFIFLGCLMTTMCSFPEIPLDLIHSQLPTDEKVRFWPPVSTCG